MDKKSPSQYVPDDQKPNLKPFPPRQIRLPQYEIIEMSSVAFLERKEQVKDDGDLCHFASYESMINAF